MFPTFISILDIQSWWEVPSIAHFCSLFRTAFNLLDFDIEDLEEALLTDGTEESSWLQELIVRLLSGCLPNNEISTFNYQMFLRRLFRQKCQEHDRYNPFNTDTDFQLLPLRTKVDILHALCDFRLDADDVLDQLKNLEADSLRVEPLGYDSNESAYWYFYGTRLYREDFKTKNNKKKSVWQVICFSEEDWFHLTKKFKKSTSKIEKQLYRTLCENFLPELPRLFREKERLARKRLLENQPRRTSSRLRKSETTVPPLSTPEPDREKPESPKALTSNDEEQQKKRDLEVRRKEAYERRNRLKQQAEESEGSQSEVSGASDEMAATKRKDKKSRGKQKKGSKASKSSKEAENKIDNKKKREKSPVLATTAAKKTTVGRQTNNSLSAVTGQILIEPVSNPHRKKLKTSQVFRQTDEDLQTGMHKILDYVKNHDDAWPFADPVEEEYAPNYYTVIRKPMDLQKMEERLDAGFYKSYTRFREDFQLIVDNCRLYNGAENEYTEMVNNLVKVFDRATEKYLDQISSSEDEIAVEFPNRNNETVDVNSKKKSDVKASKKKPTLAAKTDRRKERSPSDERVKSDSESSFVEEPPPKVKKSDKKHAKNHKVSSPKKTKESRKEKSDRNEKSENKATDKKKTGKKSSKKDVKKDDSSSRASSLSSFSRNLYSPSPPPTPDVKFDFIPKKSSANKTHSDDVMDEKIGRVKDLGSKIDDDVFGDKYKGKEKSHEPPKDKHIKLRETIEKLKAKSEISHKLKESSYDFPDEKEERTEKKKEHSSKKDKHSKHHKKDSEEVEDAGNSTIDSVFSDSKKKSNSKNTTSKNVALEALSLATEQTLKDINKWLDDTPRLSEFSSASNSPSYTGLDDFDVGVDNDLKKKSDGKLIKKDAVKDIKRRPFHRDPAKFLKRREVQRTIDRLQPGKSKGNLISTVQNSAKTDEVLTLGPTVKSKDTKNSLIVKTDDNAPKLSLGSVLDSFGKHKFIDDQKKEDVAEENPKAKVEAVEVAVKDVGSKEEPAKEPPPHVGEATPNLSAWFKAFGAPKVQPSVKKSEAKSDGATKDDEDNREDAKVALALSSPNSDSPTPGQAGTRQRKISTGSSMSERSSFSQDMDSPRIGNEERLGAYPAPYPSPLHKSPSGASPVMASPRPDVSPKAAAYPTINGQIRVGFYQDTVSNKSSPDKSCSPKENPQSPYPHYSEHVYVPHTTQNIGYSYVNSPYYSHTGNYSNTSAAPESPSPQSYYDMSKNNQYPKNYPLPSPGSNISSPSPSANAEPPPYQQVDKNPVFPVKKRAYNDCETVEEPKAKTPPKQEQPRSLAPASPQVPAPEPTRHPPQTESYPLNIPSTRTFNHADLSKYTNMGYTGPEVNFTRSLQQFTRSSDPAASVASSAPEAQMLSRYATPNSLLSMGQQAQNFARSTAPENTVQRPVQATEVGYKANDVTIPRPTYNAPTLDLDQTLGLRGNLANLSHIVDRYNNDERMLSSTQSYYSDKNLNASHMFNKPISTSASGLPMFNAPNMAIPSYSQSVQPLSSSMYNRQMTELQNPNSISNDLKNLSTLQQQNQEKKSKKRKTSSKTSSSSLSVTSEVQQTNQGFQSYAGLKTNPAAMEPSAISLKTSSVVPGSAFYGPTPTGLTGLYGDKDTYPNFLEDFRSNPNYYMAAAAAAHHRATPDTSDKQSRVTTSQSSGYSPFLATAQSRAAAGYPLGGFMPPAQAQLMDPGSQLYQHYLQAGVLNQGLLGPPGTYPTGYHPALSMRQPYDSMTRPSWL